jgi:DNA-binding transcriptional ArsR family regulator
MPKIARQHVLSNDAYAQAAQCLKSIAHPHRLIIVHLLLTGRHTVGDLAQACGISSAAASGHLRILADRGLLDPQREGQQVYYEVAEPGLAGIMQCIESRFGGRNGKRR